jgi:hypothetical protein
MAGVMLNIGERVFETSFDNIPASSTVTVLLWKNRQVCSGFVT